MKLIDIILIIICWLITFLACAQVPDYAVDGFAAIEGDGLETTTGGEGGVEVVAENVQQLKDYGSRSGKYIVYIHSTLTLSGMIPVSSNKTILGLGIDGKIEGGGFTLAGVNNVIIRNLYFTGSSDDAINVQDNAHHIWIDHNDFSNAFDGLVDIRLGSSYVTVSWNRFSDHNKTCLIGSSDDNGMIDTDRLKVTYHHNWFDRTTQRHPRCRFGEVHVYNNFYDNNGSYGVASTTSAKVMVEGNYFLNIDRPTSIQEGTSPEGFLEVRNNYFDNSDDTPQTNGITFEPSDYYDYELTDPIDVKDTVIEWAGVGKWLPEFVITSLPKSERVNSSIQVIPNPSFSRDGFLLSGLNGENVSVLIMDLYGKEVYRQMQFNSNQRVYHPLHPGLYSVWITNKINTYFEKIVIE